MKLIPLICFLLITVTSLAQKVVVEGYTFESGNRGYLNSVSVMCKNPSSQKIEFQVSSNKQGYFSFEVPANTEYDLFVSKDLFETIEQKLKVGNKKVFLKLEMKRSQGYTFEVTLAEKKTSNDLTTDAISGARIEVYNNTTREAIMDILDNERPEFSLNLEKGNHYTILIRKNGFLSKRMEAKVNVEGCILCFEGVGSITPGITDNLTDDNEFGILLANVEMERIFEGKRMEIQNLYYDVDQWYLKEDAKQELNKVFTLMRDNPSLTLELGSHTDSRGDEDFNMELSQKRAASAVSYLIEKGNIEKSRIVSRGYGESNILNDCRNGIVCNEEEHAINRRTELKIVGIMDVTEIKSLAQMKKEEQLEAEILDLFDQKQIQAKDEAELRKILKEKGLEDQKPKESSDERIKREREELLQKQRERRLTFESTDQVGNVEMKHQDTESVPPTYKPIKRQEGDDDEYGLNMDLDSQNGIKIILYQVKTPYSRKHPNIKKHKNLEMLAVEKGLIYYMQGGFKTVSEALSYYESNIAGKREYRGSFVASFKDGVMTKIDS